MLSAKGHRLNKNQQAKSDKAADALDCMIIALESGDILGALDAVINVSFPFVFDTPGERGGNNRAQTMHGTLDPDTVRDWQATMDRIAARPGMGRSRAWGEAEAETGAKQETMEKHGVSNPIPAKRGPRKKLPPTS
jgi:hypothetical protein